MTNAAVRRRGAYAPLAATYYTDDDVMEAGEDAELLFVRGLAFCAGHPASDGYITEKQVTRVVAAGMTDLDVRIKTLVRVGLWEALPGGYLVRSWLKWNKSAEELGRFRARDRDRKSAKSEAGGGSDDGGDPDPEGSEAQMDSDDFPRGKKMESDPVSISDGVGSPNATDLDSVPLTQHNTTQQDTAKTRPSSPDKPATAHDLTLFDGEETSGPEMIAEDPYPPRTAKGWDQVDLDKDPYFATFWKAYPRKVRKGEARKAWLKVMKRNLTAAEDERVDPQNIIYAAVAYQEDPARNRTELRFTAHPATWLNAEGWADYDHAGPPSEPDPDEHWRH